MGWYANMLFQTERIQKLVEASYQTIISVFDVYIEVSTNNDVAFEFEKFFEECLEFTEENAERFLRRSV